MPNICSQRKKLRPNFTRRSVQGLIFHLFEVSASRPTHHKRLQCWLSRRNRFACCNDPQTAAEEAAAAVRPAAPLTATCRWQRHWQPHIAMTSLTTAACRRRSWCSRRMSHRRRRCGVGFMRHRRANESRSALSVARVTFNCLISLSRVT